MKEINYNKNISSLHKLTYRLKAISIKSQMVFFVGINEIISKTTLAKKNKMRRMSLLDVQRYDRANIITIIRGNAEGQKKMVQNRKLRDKHIQVCSTDY